MSDWLFQVETPLGFTVRCTPGYWAFIVSEKHPVLSGREKEIQQVLRGHPVKFGEAKKIQLSYYSMGYLKHGGFAPLSNRKMGQDS
jgi:hypothetical protein